MVSRKFPSALSADLLISSSGQLNIFSNPPKNDQQTNDKQTNNQQTNDQNTNDKQTNDQQTNDQQTNNQKEEPKFDKNNIDFGAIINIILVHCNSPDQYTLTISLFWIKEFIVIGKENLLPFSPQILHAIFRSITLSEKEKYKSIVEISMETNITLQNLIKETNHDFSVQDLINSITVEGLCSQYVETKICSLNWIINLHLKFGDNLNEYYDQLFPELLKTLSEPDDQVVRLAIQVLAKLSTSELNFKKTYERIS